MAIKKDSVLLYTNPSGREVLVGSWDLHNCYTASYSKASEPIPPDYKFKRTLRSDSERATRLMKRFSPSAITARMITGADPTVSDGEVDIFIAEAMSGPPVPAPIERLRVDSINGMDLYLDVKTSTYVVVKGDEEFPATIEGFAKIVEGLSQVKKLSNKAKDDISKATSTVRMGSRILLWGPT